MNDIIVVCFRAQLNRCWLWSITHASQIRSSHVERVRSVSGSWRTDHCHANLESTRLVVKSIKVHLIRGSNSQISLIFGDRSYFETGSKLNRLIDLLNLP